MLNKMLSNLVNNICKQKDCDHLTNRNKKNNRRNFQMRQELYIFAKNIHSKDIKHSQNDT